MNRIQSRPTDALTYNPNEPKYWEREKLDQEIERVFDICAGCRLCFNLCPSFPELFGALDQTDGDVRSLSATQNQRRDRSVLRLQAVRGAMPVHAA
jgi:glycerol-3-phosphate dehydrogenase subunit C